MGCFGGSSQPKLEVPQAPQLPSVGELYQQGISNAKNVAPEAFGAREGALQDLMLGTKYYESFQPTSFEQALSNQYFQNVWPDTQKQIKHNLSLAGIESSPILAEQMAKAYGNLSTDIGSYLSDLGNQRAQYSLNQRLGIDPFSMVNPYVSQGITQGNNQAQLTYQQQMAQAQADYQAALNDYNSKSAGISSLGSLLGAGAGALLALPTGGMSVLGGSMLGGSLGGTASSFFGGGQSPIGIGDALSVAFPKSQNVYLNNPYTYSQTSKSNPYTLFGAVA